MRYLLCWLSRRLAAQHEKFFRIGVLIAMQKPLHCAGCSGRFELGLTAAILDHMNFRLP